MDWSEVFSRVGISTIGGFILKMLGGHDKLIQLLVFLVIVDSVTGFAKALSERNVDGDKIGKGVIKKMIYFVVVSVAVQIQGTFSESVPLREIVILFYIIEEFVSMIENVGYFAELPEEFTGYFKNMKKKGNDEE